jgi:hypothetical protein
LFKNNWIKGEIKMSVEVLKITSKTKTLSFDLTERMEKDLYFEIEACLKGSKRDLMLRITKKGKFVIN